jgi:hypothetical protein
VNPSRPVYSGLDPDPCAQAHLILADAEGVAAVIELFVKGDGAFAPRATLLSLAGNGLGQGLDRLGAKLLRWGRPSTLPGQKPSSERLPG